MIELPPRAMLYAGILFGAALLINLWAVQDYWDNRFQVTEAMERYETSKEQLRMIRLLENKPRIASLTEETEDDILKRVNAACGEVGIVPSNVSPGLLQPIDNSSYSKRDTNIDLNGVTLAQIIQFAEKVEDSDSGLTIGNLTLIPGQPGAADAEAWTVNLTLTQLVYSPKS
jgi:hypothetical protein